MADLAHDAAGPASSKPDDIAPQQASRSDSPARGKLRVFISYSRDDLHSADQLKALLEFLGFECLMDRENIPFGEVWRRHIGKLIRDADMVVFVLSPKSASSEFCNWEVERANKLKKRILPIISQPLEGVEPPPRLRALQHVHFYNEPKQPNSGFGSGVVKLVTTLNTEVDWVRKHTRYLQRAEEWDEGGRPTNRLLFGDDIAEAKAWAARRPMDTEPTELHNIFIRASEEEAEARLSEHRKQTEAVTAAQAEREKLQNEREEAFKQRDRFARVRNIALVVVSIFAVTALVFGWRVYEDKEYLAAKQKIEEHEKAGRFAEALKGQHEFADKERTAEAFDREVWYELLARNFPQAMTDANRAHNRFPDSLEIETERAHALMFMERGAEAKTLYLAHKGKPVSGGKLWERGIAEDFAELRAKCLKHPMMAEIEKELGISNICPSADPGGNAGD